MVRLPEDVDPTAVAAAVRAPETDVGDGVSVSCPHPSEFHHHVGCIYPEMGLRTRTALAAAGRTRGLTTPYDDELRESRQLLDDLAVETRPVSIHSDQLPDGDGEQRIDTDSEIERARLAVAAARGRLLERRDSGLDTESAEARLEAAVRKLSEIETTAIATRQETERERERRRARRDAYEEKFRLEDRVANLERQARRYLVDQLREEFHSAVLATPGSPAQQTNFTETQVFDIDAVTAALALSRIGKLRAPVVLAVDRFESPEAASDWLDAPVISLMTYDRSR